jgi:hypothetical protein
MEIVIDDDLNDLEPSASVYLQVSILLLVMRYSLGASATMSFIKASYMFDKALRKSFNFSNSNKLIEPWDLDGYFRKALLIANGLGYIDMKTSTEGIKLSLNKSGESFVDVITREGAFVDQVNLLRQNKIFESDFKNINVKCGINEYR